MRLIKGTRPIRLLAFVVVPLFLGVVVLGGVVLAEGALHIYDRPHAQTSAAEDWARQMDASWSAAELCAADGVRLSAWMFRPAPQHANGSAVLLLHGIGDTRTGMWSHANYLLDAGYAVLMPDSRGHGSSGGNVVGYGFWEAEDTARWLRWLGMQPGIERVYGLGESMGAANLLQSLALPSPVRAVVAECPFATFPEVSAYRLSHLSGIPFPFLWPVRESGFVYARLRYGVWLGAASPAVAMARSVTPVLLVHGTADTNIPLGQSRELRAVERRGETELWEVPGAVHVSAISAEPSEMPRRVIDWFRRH
jgi:dipeptidyl aminopeptidase/acylaminoacyl peptidase